MRRFRLYFRLTWICALSLFVPTGPLTKKIEETLEELKALKAEETAEAA